VFLTSKELFEMTGYKSNAAKIRWLSDNGYAFDIRRDGRPNVLIDQVRERQCKKAERAPGPDLAWLSDNG
jgi:uncharacterized protein DUF4224